MSLLIVVKLVLMRNMVWIFFCVLENEFLIGKKICVLIVVFVLFIVVVKFKKCLCKGVGNDLVVYRKVVICYVVK